LKNSWNCKERPNCKEQQEFVQREANLQKTSEFGWNLLCWVVPIFVLLVIAHIAQISGSVEAKNFALLCAAVVGFVVFVAFGLWVNLQF
jgi:hypothetical protein